MKELKSKSFLEQITLSKREIKFINIFNFYDQLDAKGYRNYMPNKNSMFEPHYIKYNAETFEEKMQVIRFSKEEKTKYLIYKKNELGYIPKKLFWDEMKTNCGRVRLIVASYHNERSNKKNI